MSVPVIGKLSIFTIIAYFIGYIILHVFIGLYHRNLITEIEEKPGNDETEKKAKWVGVLFKWFPAIYIIFLVIMLY